MPKDESGPRLEGSNLRDLVLRCMMYAAQNYSKVVASEVNSVIIFQSVLGELHIEFTVTDSSGERLGKVSVRSDSVIILEAEVNLLLASVPVVVSMYVPGKWEKQIPIPHGWIVVEADVSNLTIVIRIQK